MKLFEKIRRFIRGADKTVSETIHNRSDRTAAILESFAKRKDPEELKRGFERSWIPEPWEFAPKTDPETATRLAQMPVASLEDAIAQISEGMTQVGVKAEEAADAIRSAVAAGMKPEPLSHLTNNWRKMHGLPMRRKLPAERRRKWK